MFSRKKIRKNNLQLTHGAEVLFMGLGVLARRSSSYLLNGVSECVRGEQTTHTSFIIRCDFRCSLNLLLNRAQTQGEREWRHWSEDSKHCSKTYMSP